MRVTVSPEASGGICCGPSPGLAGGAAWDTALLTADCGEADAQSPGAGARGRSLAVRRQWWSPRLAQLRPRTPHPLSPQLSWARVPSWPCPLLQAQLGGLCPAPCSRAWGRVALPTSFLDLEISLLCFELGDICS